MTDTGSPRTAVDTTRVAYSSEPEPTAWTGWIVLASAMMFLLGSLTAIQGLVAILDDDYYAVGSDGLVIAVDYTVWGWTHLLLGMLILACGAGLLAGNLAARTVTVVLVGLNAIVNLLFIAAHPLWGVIAIAVDVLVIYAVTVHGRELHTSSI